MDVAEPLLTRWGLRNQAGAKGEVSVSRAVSRPNRDVPRRRHLILAAAIFLFVVYWWNRPTPANPEAVAVAIRHLDKRYPSRQFQRPDTQRGHLGTYRLVFLGVEADKGNYVEVTVHSSPNGLAVTGSELYVGTPGGSALPVLLLIAAAFCLAGYVFFSVIPNRFGRRCPRDHSLLEVREAQVHGSVSDERGAVRAPIIERIFWCPKCDFQHVEAMPDPEFRPQAEPVTFVTQSPLLSDGMAQRLQDEYRRAHSVMSDEEWQELLRGAKAEARKKTSADSPWVREEKQAR